MVRVGERSARLRRGRRCAGAPPARRDGRRRRRGRCRSLRCARASARRRAGRAASARRTAPREARVAPQAADVERVADHRHDAAARRLRPAARVDADLDAAGDERVDRALDEALGAAEGRVALADDAELHRGAAARAPRSRRGARRPRRRRAPRAASAGSPSGCCRRSRCCRRGGSGARSTRRRGAARCHGPHSASPLGPNSATTGVPIAAAMCIGAESTPTKSRAPADQRRELGQRQLLRRGRRPAPSSRARIAWTSACSAGSGAPVSTSGQPSAARRSTSAALACAGQHLNSQREPGCISTKAAAREAVLPQQRVRARLGGGAGHEHQPLVGVVGPEAEPAQRVEVGLDRVPQRRARRQVAVRERRRATARRRRHAPARRRGARRTAASATRRAGARSGGRRGRSAAPAAPATAATRRAPARAGPGASGCGRSCAARLIAGWPASIGAVSR